MAQSIQTSKFGTLDTSGRVPVYMAGAEGDPPSLNMGLSFDVGGKSYTFVPEDRITKGAVSGDRGSLFLGFLDPNLLSSLKSNSEYVDIAGTEFGSFDIGKFISDQMGGSTKGFLAPKDTIDPILAQGLTQYNPSFAGQVTGVGDVGGKPTYLLQSGYVLPNGQQVKTERKIVGYRYSSGGGLLAGLGNEILKAGPILPLALDVVGAAYGLPGIGTAVAGGITAGAIASGDEKTATNYAAQYAAGQLGVGSGVAEATGSTVAGQVAQGTAGGLLAGKNPEQAVTGAVQGVGLGNLASSIPPSTTAFDTTTDIPDNSGFDIPTATPQTPITGNTGGNMATDYTEDPYGYSGTPSYFNYAEDPYGYTGTPPIDYTEDPYGYAGGTGGSQVSATPGDLNALSGYGNLTIGQAQRLFNLAGGAAGGGARPLTTAQRTAQQQALGSLLGGAVGGLGGVLAGQTSAKASEEQARMISQATGQAVGGSQFRPVGTTTRFGTSQFQVDPTTGQLTSAGYQLTPELKAMQDRVMALTGQGLTEAEQAGGRYAPLTAGAQGLFGLGQQYLAQSPEQVAADYMAKQQNLLAPSRERQLAQLQTQLFNTGRGGLSIGGTGMRPGGGQGLRAASPEMEAYYNALAQQDAQLAAGAQQAGQQQVQFGAGLMGTGANLLGAYGQGLTGAYAPFSTGIGVGTSLEALGQQPLSISQELAKLSSASGARAGELGIRGTTAASVARLPSMQYNPLSRALVGAGGNTQFGNALGQFTGNALPDLLGLFSGGLPIDYGTDTRKYDKDANF